MKKYIALLLALVFALSVFTACGGDGEDKKPDDGKKPDDQQTEKIDYKGAEINIFLDPDQRTEDETGFLWYEMDNVVAEELTARKAQLEKDYNCKIVFNYDDDDVGGYITSRAATNQTGSVDLIMSISYYFRQWAKADLLVPIDEYKDIVDYKDSFRYGTKNLLELACVNGKIYGVNPYSWPDALPNCNYIIVANNKLMSETGYSDLSVYQEEGKFTRAVFEEMVKNCAQLDREIYSLDTGIETLMTEAWVSDGGRVMDPATNGIGITAPNVAESIDWAKNLMLANKDNIYLNDDKREMFKEGKAALTTGDPSFITTKVAHNDKIKEFTVLPFPKGPNADENTATGYIATAKHQISIPKIAEDVEMSATILRDLYAPLKNIPDEAALKKYYRDSVFYTDKDLEIMFDEMAKYEYNYWMEGFSWLHSTVAEESWDGMGTAASIESHKGEAWQLLGEGNVAINKAGFATYWN